MLFQGMVDRVAILRPQEGLAWRSVSSLTFRLQERSQDGNFVLEPCSRNMLEC